MHTVLSLQHYKVRILCFFKSPQHRVTVRDFALVYRAQLLVVTYQDNLLSIHHSREDLNFTGLCGFINYDFLEFDVLKASGLCCLAGCHDYGDMRQDKALHVRLDLQELIELILGKVSDAILIEAKQLKFIAHRLVPSPYLNFLGVHLEVLRVLCKVGNVLFSSTMIYHLTPAEYLVNVDVA